MDISYKEKFLFLIYFENVYLDSLSIKKMIQYF